MGSYKMPLIIIPSPPTLFSHHGEVISDYRGVGLLGSLKPHHPSISTFQRSPFSCLSLVPMFTVDLSREEQREMSLWPLVWSTGFHQYRNRWLWGLSSQRTVSGSENQFFSSPITYFLNFISLMSLWNWNSEKHIIVEKSIDIVTISRKMNVMESISLFKALLVLMAPHSSTLA